VLGVVRTLDAVVGVLDQVFHMDVVDGRLECRRERSRLVDTEAAVELDDVATQRCDDGLAAALAATFQRDARDGGVDAQHLGLLLDDGALAPLGYLVDVREGDLNRHDREGLPVVLFDLHRSSFACFFWTVGDYLKTCQNFGAAQLLQISPGFFTVRVHWHMPVPLGPMTVQPHVLLSMLSRIF
jgi:hypothetical protein